MELEAEALWEGLQEVVTEVQGVEVGQAERELGRDLRDRVEGCRHPLVERDRVPDVPWDLSQAALMKITFHMLQRGFFFKKAEKCMLVTIYALMMEDIEE